MTPTGCITKISVVVDIRAPRGNHLVTFTFEPGEVEERGLPVRVLTPRGSIHDDMLVPELDDAIALCVAQYEHRQLGARRFGRAPGCRVDHDLAEAADGVIEGFVSLATDEDEAWISFDATMRARGLYVHASDHKTHSELEFGCADEPEALAMLCGWFLHSGAARRGSRYIAFGR